MEKPEFDPEENLSWNPDEQHRLPPDNFDTTGGLVPGAGDAGSVSPQPYAENRRHEDIAVPPEVDVGAVIRHLRERGLTLDTGRPAEYFGVDSFRRYQPDYEEAVAADTLLNFHVLEKLERYEHLARDRTHGFNHETLGSKVLDLVHESDQGTVFMQIGDGRVSAHFRPAGEERLVYNTYRVLPVPFSEGYEALVLHHFNTNDLVTLADIPRYGTRPTHDVWRMRQQRIERVTADWTATDGQMCFAEAEFISGFLAAARPAYVGPQQLIDVARDRRSSKVDFLPNPHDSFTAGLTFKNSVDAYLSGIGVQEGQSLKVPLQPSNRPGEPEAAIEVGQSLVSGRHRSFSPYVRVTTNRQLTGTDFQQKLMKIGLTRPVGDIDRLDEHYGLRYYIDRTTSELMVDISQWVADQRGRLYQSFTTTHVGDELEEINIAYLLEGRRPA